MLAWREGKCSSIARTKMVDRSLHCSQTGRVEAWCCSRVRRPASMFAWSWEAAVEWLGRREAVGGCCCAWDGLSIVAEVGRM